MKGALLIVFTVIIAGVWLVGSQSGNDVLRSAILEFISRPPNSAETVVLVTFCTFDEHPGEVCQLWKATGRVPKDWSIAQGDRKIR